MENISEKTEKSLLPVVAIDGLKIKAVRETKKLTQLYVASVVGVTTDTISRWENNRYPTIKRDNAEKLASALEVELAEILRSEEPTEEAQEIPLPPVERSGRRTWLVVLTVAVLLAVVAFFFSRQMATVAVAERRLPRFGAPGAIIPVQIRISRKDSTGLIVKERLPAGWRLVNSFPQAASGQADASEVKWLIPTGSGPLTLSYTVQVSPAAPLSSTATFAGEIVAHAAEITRKATCGGDRNVTVAGVHWVDRNGDGRIDDDEIMPAYYLSEEMKGLGLDWKTIETIWSGKGYRWDPRTRGFEVIK
jgi:transcriptional regulator with XRE-family HTH domain